MSLVELKRLNATQSDIVSLQKVLEAAPQYAINTSGSPCGANAAQETFDALPQNCTKESKYLFGIYFNHELVGCIDLIKGYPNQSTAMLGLLLLKENVQRRGLGEASYNNLEKLVRSWDGISHIRIGIMDTNNSVIPFWEKMGFRFTGQSKPYKQGAVETLNLIYEKRLSEPTNTVKNIQFKYGWNSDWTHPFMDIYNQTELKRSDPLIFDTSFKNSQVVVSAWIDNNPVAAGRMLSDFSMYASIFDLVVAPQLQKSGIGREIMKRLIEKAPHCCIHLTSTFGNEAFYEKLGFKKHKTAMALYPAHRSPSPYVYNDTEAQSKS